MPNKDNIRQIIGEIAHKELIQQPMYVKECWFNQLNLLGFTLGDSTIDGIYSKLRPTNKKVVNILKFPKMDEVQTITSEFLKKFIRDLPCDVLSKFLRFCTGSDNLTLDHDGNPKDISVIFNTLKGLERRPVGHTCGMVLEMPSEYDSFLDFRSEFNNILKSDVWVMDFV
ncbi:hypothetical protein SNE40_001367 [Patella caerulea]|uniref:HECT domain-containing protein n=1 Tax=Patella caerulea TaxID=87958 RepID=A0AAN8KII2_PATCE